MTHLVKNSISLYTVVIYEVQISMRSRHRQKELVGFIPHERDDTEMEREQVL